MLSINKILKTILFLIILNSYLYSQNISSVDSIPKFRGFNWGEKLINVESQEKANYAQTCIGFGEYVVSYFGEINGIKSTIDYTFTDSALTEGSYTIHTNDFNDTFAKIRNLYTTEFGQPKFWAGSNPDSLYYFSDNNEPKLYRGPELYWEFSNGFIGIISEKYKNDISITILYAHNITIDEYGKYYSLPLEFYPAKDEK